MFSKSHPASVLVLGMGSSGQAAARFLARRGYRVVGVDSRAEALRGTPEVAAVAELRSDGEIPPLDAFAALVVSPGVPPSHPIYAAARREGLEVVGEAELACRAMRPTQRAVGITGTNGKTTVTLLVSHVLRACGWQAPAVGNVGMPLTDAVDAAGGETLFVIELSSWQLETMSSRVLDGAVVLNVTPDHLDRHGSMEAYARAKFQIARCLKASGRLFVHEEAAAEFSACLQEYATRYETYGLREGILSHDIENEMAAFALCGLFGVGEKQFCQAAATFTKPPHRNEWVRTRRGVRYINDSKGTNIDAVVKAVGCTKGSCILIAGGKDKGAAYTPWLAAFEGRVRLICAIGEAAPKIRAQLGHRLPVELFGTLAEAVAYAAKEAKSGENVLLSPGCSSYDMFESYAHRGREFVNCVNLLPE